MVHHGFHGSSWFAWFSVIVHGFPWFPIVYHGLRGSNELSVFINGSPWFSWLFVVIHSFSLFLMVSMVFLISHGS